MGYNQILEWHLICFVIIDDLYGREIDVLMVSPFCTLFLYLFFICFLSLLLLLSLCRCSWHQRTDPLEKLMTSCLRQVDVVEELIAYMMFFLFELNVLYVFLFFPFTSYIHSPHYPPRKISWFCHWSSKYKLYPEHNMFILNSLYSGVYPERITKPSLIEPNSFLIMVYHSFRSNHFINNIGFTCYTHKKRNRGKTNQRRERERERGI